MPGYEWFDTGFFQKEQSYQFRCFLYGFYGNDFY